jgi:hypothetical protein
VFAERPEEAARNAIRHSLSCPEETILECPNVCTLASAVMEGRSLEEAHPQGTARPRDPDERHNPAWRVDGKVLARRNPHLRVPDEEAVHRGRGKVVAIWAERGLGESVMRQDPATFFVTPHWDQPSVLVWLDTVSSEDLHELIVEAWRARAPNRLVREWDARRMGH